MTALAADPVASAPNTGEELTHAVCFCDDDVALCGANVAGTEWATEDEEVDCVVCQDLLLLPCARCGQ
ncbi:hypothetical protein [Streptomyces sp. JB150]|uniref:hypothetical protein n=1 Tax=Streptomyces sp. JB150 TaxID=2714844 RepID=UPI00140B0ABD|nr:hypothetical protein [Streptomyces sp. JB150]QIJ62582.1 hypothetical protein G7Z13_11440 [Streptomyces sp. JB150]